MKIINVEQRSQDWMQLRRKKISATDASVILEVSPWKSPLMLYNEKVHGKIEEETSFAMARGSVMEEEARKWAENHFGVKFKDLVVQSESHPWAIASLDGLSDCGILIEIKCPGSKTHEIAANGEIPDYYYPQCQHQLFVTGLSTCYYVSYSPISQFVVPIYRDEYFIDNMIAHELTFFRLVQNETPPPPSSLDFIPRIDKAWEETCKDWKNAKEALRVAQDSELYYRNLLINLSMEQNCTGFGVKTQKILRKGTVDYESIPELKDVDLEKYRNPSSSYWKISLNKE